MTGDNFHGKATFMRGFMRQHRVAGDVADSEDVRHSRAALRINLHKAALIDLNIGVFQTEILGVGHASDRNQHVSKSCSFSWTFSPSNTTRMPFFSSVIDTTLVSSIRCGTSL
jgi:hypothetical protein